MRGKRRDPVELELETDTSSSLLGHMLFRCATVLSIVRSGESGPTEGAKKWKSRCSVNLGTEAFATT